ncbi:CDP-archaeol synthase [Candidatus Woesearchaeota archaeon]|nr:CDP-archaeol synthase [Candidatus Woesearchaeota archaeon]
MELLFILKCFYLMLPAYFANMAPVMVKKVKLFIFPVDFNKTIGNKPILGKNKTFRGLVFGVVFSVIVAYFQFLLHNFGFFKNISFLDYQDWLLFGLLMGSGALTGDLIKSFFKRRVNIMPGSKFMPFDQVDFVIGALIFIMPVFDVTLNIFIVSLLLSFALDITVNHIAFYLKIRNEKW